MTTEIRVRTKGIRMIRAGDIRGAAWNFRSHPDSQVAVLRGSIEELGFIDPLDVFEDPETGVITLFDGHARRDLVDRVMGPDTMVPCNVTDLTEAEAKKAMLLKDPVAAMAQTNQASLAGLLQNVQVGNDALRGLLDTMKRDEHSYKPALAPVAAVSAIPTTDDIEAAQQEIADKMGESQEIRDIVCPACGQQFGIDR